MNCLCKGTILQFHCTVRTWVQQREKGPASMAQSHGDQSSVSRKALLKRWKRRTWLIYHVSVLLSEQVPWAGRSSKSRCQGTLAWGGSQVEWAGFATVVHLTSWIGENSCWSKSENRLNPSRPKRRWPQPRGGRCCCSRRAICRAPRSPLYLLVLCAPPLLLPAK